jgi:type III pantothenate kinase
MMQTLLVDLGNTCIKWAMYSGGQLQASSALLHREQEFSILLSPAWAALTRPQRVVIASVADQDRKDSLAEWVRQHWSLSAEFIVSPAQGQGLTNSYREPARLGCDRWAAMLAAFHTSHSAVCVVDCGSAVTLDVVAATGQHQGGLIIPGMQAMHAALTRQTALAPVEFSQIPQSLLGISTQEGIVIGITRAISALVQQTLSELERTTGVTATCYLTGGDAKVIAPWLHIPYVLDPDLVLKGLAIIVDAT